MQTSENILFQFNIKTTELKVKLAMMIEVNAYMKLIKRPVMYSDKALTGCLDDLSKASETSISELDQLDKGLL